MYCYEELTAVGKGTWDKEYSIELSTIHEVYYNRDKTKQQEVLSYSFWFNVNRGNTLWDGRFFVTEDARKEFLDKSLSNIALNEPVRKQQHPDACKGHPLDFLVGEKVDVISFEDEMYRDTLIISFDFIRLDIYNWPIVFQLSKLIPSDYSKYREVLADLVNTRLEEVDTYLDEGIFLSFNNGTSSVIPMYFDKDQSQNIIAYLDAGDREHIWSVGQPPFENNS